MKSKISKAKTRVSSLLDLALDYNEEDDILDGFSKLACLISGAQYSQINLLDSENQWTVAQNGMKFDHTPIEMSICNITITKEDIYEIKDFRENPDFKDHPMVVNAPFLRYYIGFPFGDESGAIIGTICLLHTEEINLLEAHLEIFSVIKQQVSTYLTQKKTLSKTHELVAQKNSQMNQVRHDIRGPLSGIIGFSGLLESESTEPNVLKRVKLIKKSAENLLDYAEKSLQEDLERKESYSFQTDINIVVHKLKSLYAMQSILKDIRLDFENTANKNAKITQISTNDALNIIGNVLSNAIKFSDKDSSIHIVFSESKEHIEVVVADKGKGIGSAVLEKLNNLEYEQGFETESNSSGFGIGLMEALNLLTHKKGSFHIDSSLDIGTQVALLFPKK